MNLKIFGFWNLPRAALRLAFLKGLGIDKKSEAVMRTKTISPESWTEFLAEFNRDHIGWAVTIETMERSESETLAERLPFQGISFDTKGTRPSSLEISVGGGDEPHVAHWVHLPLQIRTVEDKDGSVHLMIEPADGGPTILHLRAPSPSPESVVKL
jgi:hypothetical protein